MYFLKNLAIVIASALMLTTTVYADWATSPVSINGAESPSLPNAHENSGNRRMVRINDITIALAADGTSEKIYKSTGNWTQIGAAENGTRSGVLISGPNNEIYHFYKGESNATHIYMRKFDIDDVVAAPSKSLPAAVSIYDDAQIDDQTNDGVYSHVSATIDQDGDVFVFMHYRESSGVGYDCIWRLRHDYGDAWNVWDGPDKVVDDAVDHGWYYMAPDVTEGNLLVMAYSEYSSGEIRFTKSSDDGESWDDVSVTTGTTYNPALLTVGTNTVFIFGQSTEAATHDGLVYFKNTDDDSSPGDTWSSLTEIANNENSFGYADPSAALGSDGQTIYVSYRSCYDVGACIGGKNMRSRLAMTTNLGSTWTFPDNYDVGNRSGTRSHTRYQTWFNYGGPLEWKWLEGNGTDTVTVYETYYDINTDVTIYQADADNDCIGDACNDSMDQDGDKWEDNFDNCPTKANSSQDDRDGDGIGDACDNCPDDSNINQNDADDDGAGDICDNSTSCFVITIYGSHSDETAMLRYYRDSILSKSHEGKELIRLYYQWSPVIVKAMEQDGDFKADVKEMVDEMLPMIEEADE